MQNDKFVVTAEWSGSYPTLCFGEWEITVNGKKLEDLGSEPFNTKGQYSQWHFVNWIEQFTREEFGFDLDDWILNVEKDNTNNLIPALRKAGFEPTKELMSALFDAIQKQDFVTGSCGGCI